MRPESKFIQPLTQQYFHGIHDHALQLKDTIDSYMDIIGGHLDIYLSSMNQKLSEVLKVLALFSAIFSPLTFIVGIYGMNFETMPEFKWAWSYPVLWVIMLTLGISMVFFFKRKKWL